MGVTEQFAGIDMGMLIGTPLTAAASASIMLAEATAEFIDKVGFDGSGRVRNAAFAYQTQSVDEDGTCSLNEMRVDVPMLSIVPLPGLQLDEVNLTFDMEVRQSEKTNRAAQTGAGVSGGLGFGPARVNISGSVSSHKENTRSSDYSAKYHVDIRAVNHGIPEGLARVLDIMAANLTPTVTGTILKNEDGSELTEADRIYAEKRKALRRDIAEIEIRQEAARNYFHACMTQLRETAKIQQNIYRAAMTRLTANESQQDKTDKITAEFERAAASWNNFNAQAEGIIQMIVDIGEEKKDGVSDLFRLLSFKDGRAQKYGSGEVKYQALEAAQKAAAAALKQCIEIGDVIFRKRAEYSKEPSYPGARSTAGDRKPAKGVEEKV